MLALSHSNDNPSAHEPEPTDVPVGINIERLTKVFDRRVSTPQCITLFTCMILCYLIGTYTNVFVVHYIMSFNF